MNNETPDPALSGPSPHPKEDEENQQVADEKIFRPASPLKRVSAMLLLIVFVYLLIHFYRRFLNMPSF